MPCHLRLALITSILVCSASLASVTTAQQNADLVLRGGKVVTVDPDQPQAQAVAVAGDRILAVGSDEEISKLIGDATRTIELNGKLLIPGFIEGHGHFVGLGQSKMMLDLTKAETWDDIVKQVAEAANITPPGQWIIGRGWHQEKWSESPQPNVEGYPTDVEISKVTPSHPVLLTHASGHMCFANDYAMRLAGVDADTQPPSGGEILRDGSGRAIGIFRETAQRLVSRARSRDENNQSAADRRANMLRAVELAADECLRKGVTSFQDAGSSFNTIRMFESLAEQNKLRVRLWVMVRDNRQLMEKSLPDVRMVGFGNHFLTVRGIKLSIDGALGAHGAWLLMPYEDLPSSEGLNTAPIETAKELARLAVRNDYQFCVHAIGDRANREVLDIFQETFEQNPSILPRRWRIEHAQHLHPDDIPRFGQLEVIASMQGIHCTSDAVFVLQRLGPRRAQEGAYVWQKLMKSGAVVTNGTDAPVEDVDPIASFYATVTRKLKNGTEFFPDQAMSRAEALQSYTMNCAYAAFEEKIKGSITPGKLADMVVLTKDIMSCPEDEILDAKVEYTFVGGQLAYPLQTADVDASDR